ncbi:enoyl-CoA hydratase/isomerase family protein [Pollutimonas harenae]|uniref:Enoyl-CoA hydratase/isomerase family protein n=1 Tax=Pollutimonas harenae TaxID=657015 RepID=A0A853H1V9_9BURK|nr:enoyl-CoA hydratase/isomerase family protein [Pollutimonas harenae]NYT84144.1 enoyl-CoA hydratase/isomerase family protein [Pollutimonas harenae]TEA73440.1 enoyl-CoA hydratase/isomerase family protein [Pollutimonas harenae]
MITIEHTGAVALVTFNRGERRNALSLQAMQELTRVAESFKDDGQTSCVVLTGTDKEFSSGVDLKDPARWDINDKTLDERRSIALWGSRMCKAWEEVPQLTIAAIEGLNVGGGIALTLACDWRVMGNSAYMLVPEAQIGIPLGWHTVPRLVNLVGASRAKQIILLGQKMTSATALECGLADWLVDDGKAREHALMLAEQASKTPRAIIKMSKQSINAHANALNHLSCFMDVDQALLCNQSTEATQARSSFGKSAS